MNTPIVELRNFIEAIRDTGYKGTHSALAELVDNAFEAQAKTVNIEIQKLGHSKNNETIILVNDDGYGMSASELKAALQFGGSTRFGSRISTGRYGMGLPNSSVSQAKRVDIYTWTRPHATLWTYLDVDEIRSGQLTEIPYPKRKSLPKDLSKIKESHGTVIIWSKCDRLSHKQLSTLIKKLDKELGRMFREHLWSGKILKINGEYVNAVDPLFLRNGNNLTGARAYGSKLKYEIKLPDNRAGTFASPVTALFAELPVKRWSLLSNQEKRQYGISKNAGISILRAGREIDYGWYFMGEKRKENYDDWWRCEIEFGPDLDELFGVTHTKQGITPSEHLLAILTPDLEAIARKLNARVRSKFIGLKDMKTTPSERKANECDNFFEPPIIKKKSRTANRIKDDDEKMRGLKYLLSSKPLEQPEFYTAELTDTHLRLNLNKQHPFCYRFYDSLLRSRQCESATIRKYLELLLFALGRAEQQFDTDRTRRNINEFKKVWSDILASFLS